MRNAFTVHSVAHWCLLVVRKYFTIFLSASSTINTSIKPSACVLTVYLSGAGKHYEFSFSLDDQIFNDGLRLYGDRGEQEQRCKC